MTHLRSFAGVLAVAGAAGLALLPGDPAAADPPGDLTLGEEPDLPAVSLSTPEVLEGTGGANELVFLLELDKPAADGDGRDGEPSGRNAPGREPGRSTGTDPGPGSYTAGEGRTSPTTTALPTTDLETNLAGSNEPQGFDLRPVVAVALAFGAIRLLRGWHLRRQS